MTEPLSQRIDRALGWLAANRETVAQALPLTVGPATYLPGCLEKLDYWVGLYHQGQLNNHLATAYVLNPLRALYRGVNHGSNQP
ncbi:MAG: hypothetical protein KME14_20455 [Tildeniella torsiva UHER 1998/13D]|jgi:hypothetical protein|nr:hypothetical protein [Tildeniella torsiva UHER 1998/13D]